MDALYHDPQNPTTRKCSQCHQEKPIEAFNKDVSKKSGYRSACKFCLSERKKHPRIIQKPLFVISKVCKGCKKEKLLEEFDVCKACKSDGHRTWCKECRHLEHKQTYQPLKKPLPPVTNSGKICRTCMKEKPLDQFNKDKRASDGLVTQCKECIHNRVYVINREKTHERTHRNWAKNAIKYNATHGRWRVLNRVSVLEGSRKRERKMREVVAENVDYKHILERDGYWCHICEQDILPHQKIEFDHVIPVSRNGSHTAENIKVSHKTCNRRKKDMLMEELKPYHRRGVI